MGARSFQALQSTSFLDSGRGAFIDVEKRRSAKRPNVIREDALFRQIERLANGLPLVRCHVTQTGIHIEPMCQEGLPISVYRSEGRQTVCLGSWYDDLDHDAMVFSLVEKAVHGKLRLRMEGDGRKFHTFTVEVHVRDDVWIEVGQMTNYWLRKKPVRVVKYLRNMGPVGYQVQ